MNFPLSRSKSVAGSLSSFAAAIWSRCAFPCALVAFMVAALPSHAQTQLTSGDLRMEVITAYNFVVDSNIESPSGRSPSAAHLGVKLYNTGATALENVVVNIGTLTDPATSAGSPGLFPSRTVSLAETGNQYEGTFSLIAPGGTADSTRVIPRIEPGQYVAQYFFVTYPLKDSLGRSVTGSAPVTSDDLWLNYDIWAHVAQGPDTRRVNQRTKVTMRNEISAMANKIWPNGDNKVPTEYLNAIEALLGWRPSTNTPRIPGAIVKEGIWYDLGNVGAGFDNDGDGIPDRNAWMQPVGDPTIFSPLAARMAKCYGIVIVKLNDGSELLIPFEDQLYFENLPANNTGAVGLVYYEFLPLNLALPNMLTPYQEVASGFDNEKFNGDYGTAVGLVSDEPPSVSLGKTATPTVPLGGTISYTLTTTNTGTIPYGWPDLGLPVVLEDPIPTGLQYVAGSAATAANVTSNPSGGVFTVFYSADNGVTWSSTEPVPATSVNRLRWVLDRKLDPAQSATIAFQAVVPSNYFSFGILDLGAPAFSAVNTGLLISGGETVLTASATTIITGINTLGDYVWLDTNRDGLQNDGSTGIPNIGVSLYVDSNGNGTLDSGEPLYATTQTNSSGLYLFENLPDRKYIVVVNATDPDLPTGYTLKTGTSDRFAVDLDSTEADPDAVSFLDADWPFIEALEVTKTVSPISYFGGDFITYNIHLDNHMAALQIPQPNTQTVYVTSTTFDKTNASGYANRNNASGVPDNVFANIDWQANSDRLVTSGITPSFTETASIAKVEIIIRGYMSRALLNDQMDVEIGHSGRTIAPLITRTTAEMNALVGVSQDLVLDITSASGAWTWAQAQSLTAALTSNKSGGGDAGDYFVDSIGFRITTNNTPFVGSFGPDTILEWPLKDTYDPDKLEYVSASVAPDVTSPAGTLEWYNLGPVNAGARKTITVTFRAKTPIDTNADGQRDPMIATNSVTTVGVSNGVVPRFLSGLPAGHDDSSVDVTINPAGRIGDLVYWDVNANSTFDAGDVPLSGVIVQLFVNPGSGFVFTGRSQFTDANGFYEFTGLADGTYEVRITTDTANDLFTLPFTTFSSTQRAAATTILNNPANFVSGGSVIINNTDFVTTNDINLAQDFGFDSNAASLISGTLFRDWNGNGIQDPGEEPLVGFTVTLTGANSRTTTTDANGFYQFTNLTTAGNSTVTVTAPPANHVQTLDPDGVLNSATTVGVVLGNAYLDRDFAYRPNGSLSIGDTVYYDWNGNGSQDAGEGGIANITIRLYEDANADGAINPATDALIGSIDTNSSGNYIFTGLLAGNYIVMVDTGDPDFPPQHEPTDDYDYKLYSGILDDMARIASSHMTGNLTTVDFGYEPIGNNSIGNLVWQDINNNGLRDAGEAGVNGVTVHLFRADQSPGVDTPHATTTTSGGGLYGFSNLPQGGWRIFLPASNFISGGPLASLPLSSTTTSSTDNQVDDDDNGIQAGGTGSAVVSPLITLTDTESDPTIDFGFVAPGTIGDTVFYDLNGNGNLDYNETGIVGVTLELYGDLNQDGDVNDAGEDVIIDTAVTDANGFYLFSGVAPGWYAVKVRTSTLPAGVVQTADPDLDGTPVDPPSFIGDHTDDRVIVFSGANYTGADFGYQPPGAIGDFVWLDINRDGIQDPGEPGIAGVTVRVSNGSTTYDIETDFDGYWGVAVADGNWTVSIPTLLNASLYATRIPTYDADSGINLPDASVSITVSAGLVTTPAALPQGNLGLDFGFALDGAYGIAGTIATNDSPVLGKHSDIDDFLDDGLDFDAGPLDELELEGVEVFLFTDDGLYLGSVFTDASGNYAFTGLPDGTYRVIIGTTSPPLDRAELTTNDANYSGGPTVLVTSTATSVTQTVTIAGEFVEDVDFMFLSTVDFDYGDLPQSYGMTTLTQDAARHIIPDGGAVLYMGTAPDAEPNGLISLQANGDDITGTGDEDGVTYQTATWVNEADPGNTLTVNVTGSGWLVAWIDWNHDGDFLDANEMVANQAVASGSQIITFPIPAGTIVNGEDESWYSRVRLFPTAPAFPLFSYTGEALGGEVEDHLVQKTNGASLGDLVWIDLNGDGIQDVNELGLGGVTVTLRDSGNNVVGTPQTTSNGSQDVDGDGIIDPTGYYRFRNLNAGTYTVTVSDAPAGYSLSYDEDSGITSPDGITSVILATDVQHLTADFGFEPSFVNVSGQVRFDVNGDGNPADPDAGAFFVRIQLWSDPNGDGDPSDGVQVGETYTNADGNYIFSNVPTGKYVIVEINPPGATSTYDVQGSPTDDRIAVEVVSTDITDRDFLDTLPPLYAISGIVYGDTHETENNEFSSGDTPLPGIPIRLYLDRDNNGLYDALVDSIVTSTFTNLSGAYSFGSLPPGNYLVLETVPSGTTAINDVQGSPTDSLVAVTLTNTDATDRNFLLDVPGVYSISGTVLNDTTDPGVINNPGDTPLQGVVVQLRDGSGNLIDSVVTASNGTYSFPNLIPGDYRVTTVNPSGLTAVTDADGNGNGAALIDATLVDENIIGRDFLVDTTPLKIAGEIFDDRDFDNAFTAPDTFRAGMNVSLFRDANGDGIADPSEYLTYFVTSTDGSYEFPNLAPGDYLVKLTPAQRCFFVNERGEPAGNLGVLTDGQMTVTLSGTDNLDNDFLLCRGIFLSAIGDRVWLDENSNGVQDPGEAGIPNVTVRLFDSTGTFLIAETVTDTDGYYLFPNRSAQSYVVQVVSSTLPAGVAGNATYDFDGLTSLHSASVTLAGDQLRRDVDFGYNWAPITDVVDGTNTGAIGNRLWIDADGDGIQDLGEAGLAGIPVRLYYDSNGDGVINALYATTSTSADGSYIFDGLPAGIYRVEVNNGVTPAGYVQTGDPEHFSATLPSGERDNITTMPIVLGPGDVFVNADFGYQLLSDPRTVSGRIYLDYNSDGDQDGGEPGVRLVSVALLDSNGVVIARTMTNDSGAYTFPGLPNGSYSVWVNDTYRQLGGRRQTDDPDSTLDGRHSFVINNADVTALDFGYTPSEQGEGFGLISGSVFLDRDAGSDFDLEESLRGIRVYLYDSTGTTRLDDTQTDANGNYFFARLDAGDYVVKIETTTLPAGGTGLTNSIDPDGGDAHEASVAITTGEIETATNFGYLADIPRNITGTVWEDTNANGTLEGGEALRFAGITVVLYDEHGHELGWTTTNPSGQYSFTGLPAGTYYVGIVEVSKTLYGYWSSYGTPSAVGQAQIDHIEVVLGATDEVIDFGLYVDPSALGNYVWWDENEDGIQDIDEDGIAGVEVELLITWPNGGGTTRIVQTTDSNGFYSFGNLLLDEHLNGEGSGEPVFTITALNPPGIVSPIESGSATASTDSNDPAGTTATALQGASNPDTDFGFYNLYGSIAGTVRIDTTGNGIGDTAQPGVTIELVDSNGDSIDSDPDTPGVQATTTTTNGSGQYLFTNVLPGDYRIRQTVPSGYIAIDDVDDGDFTEIGTSTPVTLIDAENITGQDFTNSQPASIAGNVSLDFNGNGIVNAPPDGPMESVTVQLLDTNGSVLQTQETDASGNYLFEDLPAGNYQVRQVVPSGYIAISDADGGDFTFIGNASPISLEPGDDVTDQNFVNAGLSSISGYVYNDVNYNGSSYVGIPGVTITLKDANGDDIDSDPNQPGVQPTTTATLVDGYYIFPDLPPGTYQIHQSQPSGFFSLGDVDGGNPDVIGDVVSLNLGLGTTVTNRNFVEFAPKCPDLWSAWQTKWDTDLGGQTGLTQNPEGDRYSNLIEYAFCLPPNIGILNPYCLVPSLGGEDKVDLVFRRTAGAPQDIRYTLEWVSTLANPTLWTGSEALTEVNTTVAIQNDGTEFVRVSDLQTFTGLTSGFVRIKAELMDGLTVLATDYTEVAGWTSNLLSSNCRTFSTPYVSCPVFSGTVSSVSGQILTTSSGGDLDLNGYLTAAHYLEITSGVHEGQRFDIVEGGVNSFTVSAGGNSTSAALPQSDLVGSTFVVRTHHTLGSLFRPLSAFIAHPSLPASATNLQFYAPGATPWTNYWLKANDAPASDTWALAGDGALSDRASVIVPPGQGMFLQMPPDFGSADPGDPSNTRFLTFGQVRENAFLRPLQTGANLMGGGFPVDQSASAANGRAMRDIAPTLDNDFVGTTDFKTADQFILWKGDNVRNATGYDTYYQTTLAGRWVQVGDSTLGNKSATTLFFYDRAVFLRVGRDIPKYKTPVPWSMGAFQEIP